MSNQKDTKDTKNTKNIYQRMSDISNSLQYLQKDGVNQSQRYKFVSESAVTLAASEKMAENGVYMHFTCVEQKMTEISINNKSAIDCLVTVDVEYINVDEPDQRVKSTFFGTGRDYGDKAIYKAITGAMKYAITKTFMISTGEDPEHDKGDTQNQAQATHRQPQPAQHRQSPVPDKIDVTNIDVINGTCEKSKYYQTMYSKVQSANDVEYVRKCYTEVSNDKTINEASKTWLLDLIKTQGKNLANNKKSNSSSDEDKESDPQNVA